MPNDRTTVGGIVMLTSGSKLFEVQFIAVANGISGRNCHLRGTATRAMG